MGEAFLGCAITWTLNCLMLRHTEMDQVSK